MLPASVHKALRLFPYWHGSNRQAQAPLPSGHAAYQVTLHPGDVLFVPSRVFHRVESLTPSVSVNWWTGGLDRDVWVYVMGAGLEGGGGGGRWTNGICAPNTESPMERSLSVLVCVREAYAMLLATVAAAGEGGGHTASTARLHARRLLAERASALVGSRYEPLRSRLQPPSSRLGGSCQHDDESGESGEGAAVWRALQGKEEGVHVPEGGRISLSRVQETAYALLMLTPSHRDLALDDLLDHTAAWAVGQAFGEEADGGGVLAFLVECCSAARPA
jgi:hypothetical protein